MCEFHSATVVHAFTAAWEYQCCGTPVSVGDELTLRHVAWDEGLPGNDAYRRVQHLDWYVGHHVTSEEEGAAEDLVRVLALWEAHSDLDFRAGDDGYYAAARDSGRLVPITTMVPFDATWAGDDPPTPSARHTPREPQGWIMKLEVLRRDG